MQPHATAGPFPFTGAMPAAVFRRRPRLNPAATIVDNIAKVIGAGATARLCAAFGGRRVYIAERPAPGDPIVEAIGHLAAARLGAIFGGERVWLPNDAGRSTRVRIAALRRRGASISSIARELGCSERYVYKVLAQLRDE